MDENTKKMLQSLGFWDANNDADFRFAGGQGQGPTGPSEGASELSMDDIPMDGAVPAEDGEPELSMGDIPMDDTDGGAMAGPDGPDAGVMGPDAGADARGGPGTGPDDIGEDGGDPGGEVPSGATGSGGGGAPPGDGPDDVPDDGSDEDDERIILRSLPDILGKSYLNYAMSVIVARALPDVRDGLKPVHRRILYSMYKCGLFKGSPYKKCATTVGDVLGHYHPHGDSSVYDALVRLAQDFSMRYPLIDGHGNFGSMDGDPPAAYRYTEARLDRIADEMLRDIDKDTIDWNDNFDNSMKEPAVLPSRFPNILANGSQGIAVGMACNIPPHNMGELVDACVLMLRNDAAGKDTTVPELLEIVKGPDFPTGGNILGESWREVYATGKGRIELEAVYHMEHEKKSKKPLIVFTEIPYQVNKGGESKSSLMSEIVRCVKTRKLDVSDVRDESNRDGVRVVVELRRSAVPELVLNNLLQHTKLRSGFSAQMLMLVDGRPEFLPLDKILRHYLDYQAEIVRRRTAYEADKAAKRKHILEGMIKAVDNIDAVVALIRSSDDPAEDLKARFGMSDGQAQAVLDIRLRALQKLERDKLVAELSEKDAEEARCRRLMSDPNAMRDQLVSELTALKKKYGDPRRTGHKAAVGDFVADDLVEDEPCVIMRTDMGYVKRMKPGAFRLQKRGGRGSHVATAGGDCVLDMVSATALSRVMFFTDLGRVYCVRAYQIPDTAKTARGTALAGLLPKMRPDENVTGMVVMDKSGADDSHLVVGTVGGVIKRVPLSDLPENIRSSGLALIDLDEGDHVCGTAVAADDDMVLVVTKDGNCASYPSSLVRAVSRIARGVKSINLADGDGVAAVTVCARGSTVLIVTEAGYGKRVPADEVPAYKSRAVDGAQCIKVSDRPVVGRVAKVLPVDPSVDVDGTDVVLTGSNGQVIRIPLASVPAYGRRAKGLRMINLGDGVRIISAALTERSPDGAEDADGMETDEGVPDGDAFAEDALVDGGSEEGTAAGAESEDAGQ